MTPVNGQTFQFQMLSNKIFFILTIFILNFIHTTFASTKKENFTLQDTENNVKDVEPVEIEEQLVSQTKEQVAEQFKTLLDNEDYDGIVKIGNNMNEKDFSEHLCSAMTTQDHFMSLFGYIRNHDLIPDLLAYGNQSLVKEVIVEFSISHSQYHICFEDISKSIILRLNEDRHDNVLNLLGAMRARYAEEDRRLKKEELNANFIASIGIFFQKYLQGESVVSLKRFITFKGEELWRKYPNVFAVFFPALMYFLSLHIHDPDLGQFYNDLLGQSSPLMPTTPSTGFLLETGISSQQPQIMGEWREAIAAGLKDESLHTRLDLWNAIMAKYPNEFPTEFPPSDDTLTAVLEKFKTKQELEDDWTRKNIPILLEKLEAIAFNLPTVLWNIIFGYATITWATTLSWETDNTYEVIEIEDDTVLEQDSQQRQVIIQKQEQFKELFDQGEYDEIIKLGKDMENSEFLRHICPSMTTLDHLKGLFEYLKNRKMLLSFLVYGSAKLVEEAIIEFDNPYSIFYIARKLILKSITFFFNKGIYGRVIDILKATRAKYTKHCTGMEQSEVESLFHSIMRHWFITYAPEENGFLIKRFLALRGEEFATKYPDVFDAFCLALVNHLRSKIDYPKAESFLVDFIGQRSLLTSATFAKGFLSIDDDAIRFDFFIHGWKEAIEEGLKQECLGGGEQLWNVMVRNFPKQFAGAYPDTDVLRAAVCAGIKTKQEIEDEWIAETLSMLLEPLEDITAFLPKIPLNIIFKYLEFTWIDQVIHGKYIIRLINTIHNN